MKPIRLSGHAAEQLRFRGTEIAEIEKTIREGLWKSAKSGRFECRMDFAFGKQWNNKIYRTKQVRPIFIETDNEILVITVYTYYFD